MHSNSFCPQHQVYDCLDVLVQKIKFHEDLITSCTPTYSPSSRWMKIVMMSTCIHHKTHLCHTVNLYSPQDTPLSYCQPVLTTDSPLSYCQPVLTTDTPLSYCQPVLTTDTPLSYCQPVLTTDSPLSYCQPVLTTDTPLSCNLYSPLTHLCHVNLYSPLTHLCHVSLYSPLTHLSHTVNLYSQQDTPLS